MRMPRGSAAAAIGFTIKSGWAAVVLLTGTDAAPAIVSNERIELSDPDEPDQRQPYHAGFGTARADDETLARLVEGVRTYSRRSVHAALASARDSGHDIHRAGIVVGSTVDPTTIANDHVRIHALEGKLFREVVADAAAAGGVTCTIWRERDLYAAAAAALQRSEGDLKAAVTAFKKTTAGPWRGEQKAAATAAWILLGARRSRSGRV
jgi:hypothetical protein